MVARVKLKARLEPVEPWPPNYVGVYEFRQQQLLRMRSDAKLLVGAKEYYKTRPVEFISHWCDTYDPRNSGSNVPARIPFVLFKRQKDIVEFLLTCLEGEANGLVEKCRDMGATFTCCAFSVWLWLFWPGASIGWGSRKRDLVDRIGDLDSIFEKIRMIVQALPPVFLPDGFSAGAHMAFMRLVNPETSATITGESGDDIGRGGRKLIYFKDESAHYEHPEKIEAALTDNTRCQIDISSVNGPGNVFHRRREAGVDWAHGQAVIKGRTNVLVLDWHEHPAKTQGWYNTRKQEATDNGLLHIFAQEVDRNYAAALEGVIIPGEWVVAAIDAHLRLGFDDSGGWGAALDVADGGGDTNALAIRKGVVLKSCTEWGERDTGVTTRRAVDGCRPYCPLNLQYDCIGVGSGIKAETNRLKDENLLPKGLQLIPWNAGAEVQDKEKRVVEKDQNSPLNEDFFTNFKAQAWWSVRRRFELTWRAINDKTFTMGTWMPDQLISLSSEIPLIRKIQKELSQATMGQGSRLKLVVDKSPEGTKSPNLADSIIMAYFPVKRPIPMRITADVLAQASIPLRGSIMRNPIRGRL